MATFFGILVTVIAIVAWVLARQVKQEQAALRAMSPEQRATYTFGQVNGHLICPHCQTPGRVRAKKVERTVTTAGTVGGVLKTDIDTKVTTQATQHHCDQCSTTWDV